eukprot:TRINITY_DN4953_c0_g1_i1.p2 TRINITY_DN4953_c0_g1~~TRINITY_DN4953_c0_g1_i1.p2  ORF type:complete len:253 (-),score=83.96 TRINITY_DN4953_c0_g1_i1:295-960(-)
MPLGISLFGAQSTQEAKKENAKEMLREWQGKLRGEIRGIERSIRTIERDEEKIKRDIKTLAKQGADPKNIAVLAKSVVRSGKAKGRMYTARSGLMTASSELQNMAATMRLNDSMKKSTEVMHAVGQLTNVPELQESMQTLQTEMMRAGLIDEMIEEGMEDLDGPDMEEEAAGEVDKVLEDLAIDAAVRMAITAPASAEAAPEAAVAAPATAAPARAAVGAS